MSDKLLNKVLVIGKWALIAISVVLFAIFAVQIVGSDGREAQLDACAPVLDWTYLLLGIAVVVALVFPLIFLFRYPKKAIKLAISLGILALILVISYVLADSTPIVTATSAQNMDFSDPKVLSFTDTGLIATYILLGIAIVLLAATGIRASIRSSK
jgi:hypothetical protein